MSARRAAVETTIIAIAALSYVQDAAKRLKTQ